jgi:hypothetical protein
VPMIDVSARLGVDLATERPVLLQTHSKCAFPSLPVSPRGLYQQWFIGFALYFVIEITL